MAGFDPSTEAAEAADKAPEMPLGRALQAPEHEALRGDLRSVGGHTRQKSNRRTDHRTE